MRFNLAFPEDIQEQLLSRDSWIFVFGRTHLDWIDMVDELVGKPTSTIMGPGPVMTIVPKADLPSDKLRKWFEENRVPVPGGAKFDGERDIFLLADTMGEALLLQQALMEIADLDMEGVAN